MYTRMCTYMWKLGAVPSVFVKYSAPCFETVTLAESGVHQLVRTSEIHLSSPHPSPTNNPPALGLFCFMCRNVLPACMSVDHVHVWKPEEGTGSPLEMELLRANGIEPHMVAGTRTWVLWRGSQYSGPLLTFLKQFSGS